MQIVPEILKKVELAGAQLIAVTKYFSSTDTKKFIKELSLDSVVLGFGENRITQILEKNIPRDQLHFIGNIQSRDIPEIAKSCSVIHSLCSLKHAWILSKQEQIPSVFIQINISQEPQKSGIMPGSLEKFLQNIQELNLNIEGISAIGSGKFNEKQKRAEFQELISLRNKFLPGKKISAGTSRDFEIALEEGIEIVRVGQALFKSANIK
jgi:PLP dependent protein